MNIHKKLIELKQKKQCCFAILIDPEKYSLDRLKQIIKDCNKYNAGFILVGGTTSMASDTIKLIKQIKKLTSISILIFPGPETPVDKNADAFMLLSLISGRNPDYLIGKHVLNSMQIKSSGIEILPTGYMLIDGGNISATQYITNTSPIPAHKPEIAVATALAGEQLGLKYIYLEAGSGAINPVNAETIKAIAKNCSLPLFVGGGIRSEQQVLTAAKNGATVIVLGTAIENQEITIKEIAESLKN